MADTTGMFVNDFLILPGQWRPQCRWEHIAWISPPWPSQYYLWLDLPETVFCEAGNLFLSHINFQFPSAFPDLPRVPWTVTPTGIACRRRLPNGVEFEVRIAKRDAISVALTLEIFNGSGGPLRKLRTQTCAYLRGLKEFSECTVLNKYVCEANGRWTLLEQCGGRCDYPEGRLALPVVVTRSNVGNRLAAMTWFEDTGPIWMNPEHPCMHADPQFPDLAPGARHAVNGALIFFEGSLDAFADRFRQEAKR